MDKKVLRINGNSVVVVRTSTGFKVMSGEVDDMFGSVTLIKGLDGEYSILDHKGTMTDEATQVVQVIIENKITDLSKLN